MVRPVGQQPPHWRVATAHNALFLGKAFTNQRHFENFVSENLSVSNGQLHQNEPTEAYNQTSGRAGQRNRERP